MATIHSPEASRELAAPPDRVPALADGSRGTRLALGAFRIGVAFLWIQNTGWKVPPGFGSLHAYTADAVSHPTYAPWAWVIQHLVLPNFTAFAWLTLLVEASLGAFLLVGLATRLVAVLAIGQVLAITLSAINAPHEWEWSYYLMILAHLAIFATAAGRAYGLDAVLRPGWLASDTRFARAMVRFS